MAGPYNAGTVFLQVVPSFRGVQDAARRAAREYTDAFGKEYEKQLGDKTDSAAKRAGKSIVSESKTAGRTAGDQAGGALAEGLQKRLKAAIKALPDIKIDADTSDADRKLASLRRTLKTIQEAHLKLELDDTRAIKEIADVHRMMRDLNGETANVSVKSNTSVALRQLSEIERVVGQLSGQTATVNVEADGVGRAVAGLNSVTVAANRLNGQRARVKVDVDGGARAVGTLGGLSAAFNNARTSGDSAGNALRIFNGWVLAFTTVGPAAIPILAGLAGGLGAVAVGASGAASGLGVLVLGLSGISDAVGAMGDVADNSARDAAQSARTTRAAANALRDAQIGLTRAREDGAQRIADAARRVADAERSASDSIASALEAHRQAEQRLADTQRDAQRAQEDLVQARIDAARELDDLADRGRAGAIAERQAVVDLFNATVSYRNAQADPGATNLEQEEAAIAYERAKFALEEIREDNKRNADEQRKANKAGIEGSERVRTAQERLVDALRAQQEAHRDLGRTAQAVDRARLDGARLVADALRDQRRAQVDSARSISDAERRLSDAQLGMQEALTQTGVVGSAAMQKLEIAMGKLGPAGRRFARFIFGLRDEFFKLRNVAQAGFLPELQAGIERLITQYGPGFTRFVRDIANVLGDLFTRAADMFASPVWQSIFSTFAKYAPAFLKQFGEIILNTMTVFGVIAAAFAPITKEFGDALVGITGSLAEWAVEFTKSQGFQDFLDYLRKQGPRIAEFLTALIGALLNLAIALAPYADTILGLLTGFLNFIAGIPPDVLGVIVVGLIGIVGAFQILAGIYGVVSMLINVGSALAAISPVALIVIAVVALIGFALFVLWSKSETFRDIVKGVWNAIKKAVKAVADFFTEKVGPGIAAAWDAIVNATRVVGRVIKRIWDGWIFPVIDLFGTMIWRLLKWFFTPAIDGIKLIWKGLSIAFNWVYDHGIKPLFRQFGKAVEALKPIFREVVKWIGEKWAQLKNLAKTPIKFIIVTVLNNGLIAGFNKLADFFDTKKMSKIPVPRGWARGGVEGVRPGYTPGRDTHLIAVSGGEAIMRPEWTRAMGVDAINAMNKVARQGGAAAVRKFIGGFADGGIVSWKGHRFTRAMVQRMQLAQRLSDASFAITQGGFRPATSYSGTTHGRDAVDISRPITRAVVNALRASRIAAWHRTPAQGPWGHHIHGVPLPGGGVQLSASALGQTRDYLHGGDGLGGIDSSGGGVLGFLKGVAGWVLKALSSPVKWLKDRIDGPLQKLGEGPFFTMLKAVPSQIVDAMGDRIASLFGFGGDPGSPNASGPVKQMVKKLAAGRGWVGGQWTALHQLIQGESSWNPRAQNPHSSAYGLFQFLDGTWGSVGGHKTSNPRLQATYGLRYIAQRYGTPMNAYNKWKGRSPHWYSEGGVVGEDGGEAPTMYDNGGFLPPGLSTVVNMTGRPEPVFTPDQWDRIESSSRGFQATIYTQSNASPDDIADAFHFAYRRISRGGVYAGA